MLAASKRSNKMKIRSQNETENEERKIVPSQFDMHCTITSFHEISSAVIKNTQQRKKIVKKGK